MRTLQNYILMNLSIVVCVTWNTCIAQTQFMHWFYG